MKAKLKIAFVGTGGMGQMAHLSNYATLQDECEIVAVAEPKIELAAKIAARYGIPRVYRNHEELLDAGGFDAIVAAQPYRRHSILIPDILRAGIPVFTEKPLCLGVEEGEKLVRIGEEYGTLHMVGYHKRSDPATEYAKAAVDEIVRTGRMGPMRYVRVTLPGGDWMNGVDPFVTTDEPNPVMTLESDPPGFDRTDAAQYDSFVNFYIHQINLIRHLAGDTFTVTHADPSGVLLVGHTPGNLCVTLEMNPYHTFHEWKETVLVGFSGGCVQLELPAPLARQRPGKVEILTDGGNGYPQYVKPVLPPVSAMKNQARNFLAAVRGERPAPCDAADALKDLVIARDYIRLMSPAFHAI